MTTIGFSLIVLGIAVGLLVSRHEFHHRSAGGALRYDSFASALSWSLLRKVGRLGAVLLILLGGGLCVAYGLGNKAEQETIYKEISLAMVEGEWELRNTGLTCGTRRVSVNDGSITLDGESAHIVSNTGKTKSGTSFPYKGIRTRGAFADTPVEYENRHLVLWQNGEKCLYQKVTPSAFEAKLRQHDAEAEHETNAIMKALAR